MDTSSLRDQILANARMLYDNINPLEVITQTQVRHGPIPQRIWMVIVMTKTATGCANLLVQSEPNPCLYSAYTSLLVATSSKLTEMMADKYLQALDKGTYPCSCGVEGCAVFEGRKKVTGVQENMQNGVEQAVHSCGGSDGDTGGAYPPGSPNEGSLI